MEYVLLKQNKVHKPLALISWANFYLVIKKIKEQPTYMCFLVINL